jgi:hypothetical protein
VKDVDVLAVTDTRTVDLEAQKMIASLRQERNVLDLVDARRIVRQRARSSIRLPAWPMEWAHREPREGDG